MSCQRLARAVTGRSKLLGACHGAGVIGLFPQRLAAFPHAGPSSAGLPQSTVDEALVVSYNDLNTVIALIETHGHELVAVIMEPLRRCTPPQRGCLKGVQSATRAANCVVDI